MTTFTVEWTIEVEATSPEEAARHALMIQRATIDSVSHVHHFDVYCDDADEGDGYHHHQVTIDGRDEPQRRPSLRPVTLSDWQSELDRHFPSDRKIAEDAGLA